MQQSLNASLKNLEYQYVALNDNILAKVTNNKCTDIFSVMRACSTYIYVYVVRFAKGCIIHNANEYFSPCKANANTNVISHHHRQVTHVTLKLLHSHETALKRIENVNQQ